jgi:hypothetical protein
MAFEMGLTRFEIFPHLNALSELVNGEDKLTTIAAGIAILTVGFHKPKNIAFVPTYLNLPLHFDLVASNETLDEPKIYQTLPIENLRWERIKRASELYNTLDGPFCMDMGLQRLVDVGMTLINGIWTPMAAKDEVIQISNGVKDFYEGKMWSKFMGHEYWKMLTTANREVLETKGLLRLTQRLYMGDPNSKLGSELYIVQNQDGEYIN